MIHLAEKGVKSQQQSTQSNGTGRKDGIKEPNLLRAATLRIQALLLACMMLSGITGCMDRGTKPEALPLEDSTAVDSIESDSIVDMVESEPMPSAADELFDDFFFNYAASRKVQKERTHFPLPVITYGKRSVMQAEQWKRENFFMVQGYYILVFNKATQLELMKDTAVGNVIVERIAMAREKVTRWYFARERGLWKLDSIDHISLRQYPDEHFMRFYNRFVNDSLFQQQSLAEVISFTGPDPDDDFSTMTGDIMPEQWPMFKPWLPSGTLYNIRYGKAPYPVSGVRFFFIRGIANGLQTDLVFTRKEKTWRLKKVTM